jgi:hypothetical protein
LIVAPGPGDDAAVRRFLFVVGLLAIVAAVVRPTEVRAGACGGMGDLGTESAYVTEGAMPPDGAFLWVLPSASYRGPPPPGRLLRGADGQEVQLLEEMLAPNLRVRRPASALGAGAWRLDGDGAGAWRLDGTARTVTVDASLPALDLPAPALRSIRWRGARRVQDRSGSTMSEGWLEGRARAHPTGAVGLVLSEGAAATPVVFIAAAESPFTVYERSGRCSPSIGVRIERGTPVTARFVDQWGRLSPPSRPVVVR